MEVINYVSGGDVFDDILKKKLYKKPELLIPLGLFLGISIKLILEKIADYDPPEQAPEDVFTEQKKPKSKPEPELKIKPKSKINIELDSFNINNVKICFTKLPKELGTKMFLNNEKYYRTGQNYEKNSFILATVFNVQNNEQSYDYKNILEIELRFADKSETGKVIYESKNGAFKVLYFENSNKKPGLEKINGFYKIAYNLSDENKNEEIFICYSKLLADFTNGIGNKPKSEVLHLDTYIPGFGYDYVIFRNIYNFMVTYEGIGFQLNLFTDKNTFIANLQNKIEVVNEFIGNNNIVTISFHTKYEDMLKNGSIKINNHTRLDSDLKTYRIYLTHDFLEFDISTVFDHFLNQSKYQNLDLNSTKLNFRKWNPEYIIWEKIERTFNKLISYSKKYVFDRKIYIKNKIHKITELDKNHKIKYNFETVAEVFFEISGKDIKCKMYYSDEGFDDKKLISYFKSNENLIEIFQYKSKHDGVYLLHIKLTPNPETEINFEKLKPVIAESIRKMIDVFQEGEYTLLDLSTLDKYDTKIDAKSYQKDIINIFKDEIKKTKPEICWSVKLPDSRVSGASSGNYFNPIFVVFILVLIVVLLLLIIMYKFLCKEKYKYGTKSPEF